MPWRRMFTGLALAIATGCYDIPQPDCGFACGPDQACPDGYTCRDDQRCHRDGTLPTAVCSGPDAAALDAGASDGASDGAPE